MPRTYQNKNLEWLLANVNHQGDDCLIWPFGRTGHGYGALKIKQRQFGAHRMMAELAHGEAPLGSKSFACHNCGKGKFGCVNPKHIYWGTIGDNAKDAIRHGVLVRGEKQHLAKLTEKAVIEIKRCLSMRKGDIEISRMFGVNPATIWSIRSGKSWAWVADGQ